MPLNPGTLTSALLRLDVPEGPKSIPEAAQAWADAWKSFIQESIYLTPGVGELMALTFKNVLQPSFTPTPVPGTFLLGLQGAMLAGLASAIWLPSVTSLTPPPSPFPPMALSVIATGMASSDKNPPRVALALAIYTWTITGMVVTPSGPLPLS